MSISDNSTNSQSHTKRHLFPSPQKILFINNKGGVGKTSIAFNTASKLAQKGYKICIVDLDPQCNTTMYAVGNNIEDSESDSLFTEDYQNQNPKTIYEIIKPQIEGAGDVLYSEKPKKLKENLYLISGDLSLSLYEEAASNAYIQAQAGQILGFRIISAINRYIDRTGRDLDIDIFIMDTSPSLGMMNKLFLLGSDYFVVPVLSDAFSYQGIENLSSTLTRWKSEWKNVKRTVAQTNSIPSDLILWGEPKCLGYISNKEKPYNKQQTKSQQKWATKILESANINLTEHAEKKSAQNIKMIGLADYGTIVNESQRVNKAIFEMNSKDTQQINIKGSKDLFIKSNEEFETLADSLIERINPTN